MASLNIQLLLTGDELMNGDIVDSNSAMIAEHLSSLGVNISRKVTLADDLAMLVNEIQLISKQADIVIINGGLGPTVDDLTALALAKATNTQLKQHHQAVEHLNNWCAHKGILLEDGNLKQAMLPENADVIANRVGSAVGFSLNFQACDIYCTPGVPSELDIMMAEQIVPLIQKQLPQGQYYLVKRYQVFGIGESKLQALINQAFRQWPVEISLGFRAASPMLEVKLTIKSQHHLPLLMQWQQKLYDLLGAHILAPIKQHMPTMAEHVLTELTKQGKTITTAESCTGGLIASLITNISGSSTAFEAGFVTYSNEMKTQMVNVSPQTLNLYGAVSEQVVLEMAHGAIAKANADYAIAVSGIAGPTGGTIDKPVGSVWIAWGHKHKLKTQYFCIKGERQYFQMMVAHRALDLVRRELIKSEQTPLYFASLP